MCLSLMSLQMYEEAENRHSPRSSFSCHGTRAVLSTWDANWSFPTSHLKEKYPALPLLISPWLESLCISQSYSEKLRTTSGLEKRCGTRWSTRTRKDQEYGTVISPLVWKSLLKIWFFTSVMFCIYFLILTVPLSIEILQSELQNLKIIKKNIFETSAICNAQLILHHPFRNGRGFHNIWCIS